MREGLITMIYKQKGDVAELKNWRPITLMNCDYKILTKVLANRIKPVMGDVVSEDQGCGVNGRTIHDQLILLQETYDYHVQSGRSCLFISLDQEKAFDRLNHSFMIDVLEKMNVHVPKRLLTDN